MNPISRMICGATCVWLILTGPALTEDGPTKVPRAGIASTTPEDLHLLSASARQLAPRVFLVGNPKWGQSTGVLICKRDRLVATAAHVVDLHVGDEPNLAIADGTAVPYRVEKVWFHPGIVRELDGGLSAVSDDPRDGPVDQLGPDVAVVRLADGGPELPEPCTLADDQVLSSMDGRAMGLLGYPISMGRVWPTPERPAWATLAAGIFIREAEDSRWHRLFERGQIYWTSALLKDGSSGGPAFLTDGRVVGTIVGGSPAPNGTYYSRCHTADLIREVLSYHRIEGHGHEVKAASVPPASWRPDPNLPRLREARDTIAEAKRLRGSGDYQAAGILCNKIIDLHPEYAYAYLERSIIYNDYCDDFWELLADDLRVRFARWACADSRRCIDLYTQRLLPYIVAAENTLLLARAESDDAALRRNVLEIDRILEDERIVRWQKVLALKCRARCRELLKDQAGALKDFDAANELDSP